ncbi:hypothetical protein FQN57_003150 [Myotisia sp. PD_48]|nr:hypothetical protein FQN57_003150 [Myotisia sp. PD_48]
MVLTRLGRRSYHVRPSELPNEANLAGKWKRWKTTLFGRNVDSLSFDMIVNGYTCSPCGVLDFMNYMEYVEMAPENLRFYLWYRDYIYRFAALPESQSALSPPWTTTHRTKTSRRTTGSSTIPKISVPKAAVTRVDSGFGSKGKNELYDLTPLTSSLDVCHSEYPQSTHSLQSLGDWDNHSPTSDDRDSINGATAATAYSVGSRLPLPAQPFRKEINRIIAIYLSDGSPSQLNLTSTERKALVQALTITTHPSAFDRVAEGVEWNLRQQSHPQFIRPQLHRWELFREIEQQSLHGIQLNGKSLDMFESATSYDDEPWVIKYEKRSFLKRAFGPSIRSQDPAVRRLYIIVLARSIGMGFVAGSLIVYDPRVTRVRNPTLVISVIWNTTPPTPPTNIWDIVKAGFNSR